MEQQERKPMTRRDRMRRTLAVNAFWGIDSESHCHDLETACPHQDFEQTEDGDAYIVSVDLETGELSTAPSVSE